MPASTAVDGVEASIVAVATEYSNKPVTTTTATSALAASSMSPEQTLSSASSVSGLVSLGHERRRLKNAVKFDVAAKVQQWTDQRYRWNERSRWCECSDDVICVLFCVAP
jgi:hypothetical protein